MSQEIASNVAERIGLGLDGAGAEMISPSPSSSVLLGTVTTRTTISYFPDVPTGQRYVL